MLEATDGDQGSYLDIAGVVEEHSPVAADDLRQLWRRIAFSVLIRNTDDHLRNHGFLRVSTAGWSLSPAFDLNPDPRPGPKHLSTTIDYDTSEARIDVVLGVAEMFRLRDNEAQAVLREVTNATARWRAVAADAGLEGDAIERMARAFEHDQTERARDLVMSSARPSHLIPRVTPPAQAGAKGARALGTPVSACPFRWGVVSVSCGAAASRKGAPDDHAEVV